MGTAEKILQRNTTMGLCAKNAVTEFERKIQILRTAIFLFTCWLSVSKTSRLKIWPGRVLSVSATNRFVEAKLTQEVQMICTIGPCYRADVIVFCS